MMKNRADKEQQEKELAMHRLELNVQWEENRAQCQMMQMMMVTLMTHNNPISSIARNIKGTAATEGNQNVNIANVNIARNKKTDKEDESVDKFV